VLFFACGIAGGVMGMIWFSSKREVVARVAQSGGPPPYGYGSSPPYGYAAPQPGWGPPPGTGWSPPSSGPPPYPPPPPPPPPPGSPL
jgi:hypothetical protein